jgi:hypothetical protein
MAIPIDATASDSPTVLAANITWPVFIAVDANGIYWGARNVPNATTPCENCIVSMPIAGGALEPAGLAVNANAIYWTACDLAPVQTPLLLNPAPCYGYGGFNKATPE